MGFALIYEYQNEYLEGSWVLSKWYSNEFSSPADVGSWLCFSSKCIASYWGGLKSNQTSAAYPYDITSNSYWEQPEPKDKEPGVWCRNAEVAANFREKD